MNRPIGLGIRNIIFCKNKNDLPMILGITRFQYLNISQSDSISFVPMSGGRCQNGLSDRVVKKMHWTRSINICRSITSIMLSRNSLPSNSDTRGLLSSSFFLDPIYCPRITFALPQRSNSDPGSHSGPSFPLPTTVRAFIFIETIIQHFFPSSTRVELCLPTMLGVLSFG